MKLSEEQAAQNALIGYLMGGLVGAMIASSADDEAYRAPKRISVRQVYDECMAKLGRASAE